MPNENEPAASPDTTDAVGAEIHNAATRAQNPISSKNLNIPATKQFAVNATGNLFVATTLNGGADGNVVIAKEAQVAFGQVSVFFAAMTKAMAESGKSLYDFDAMSKLINASGLFVNVNKTDVQFTSKSWGVTFGNELIQALLGLGGNLASVAQSLKSLISSVGKEGLSVGRDTSKKDSNVGTLIFVCEYLLGAVSITPIAIYANATANAKSFEAGPCFKQQSSENTLLLKKEVYLFVPPAFMEHAGELVESMTNPEFNKLVDSMKADITAGDA